jgi:hypothetical protein
LKRAHCTHLSPPNPAHTPHWSKRPERITTPLRIASLFSRSHPPNSSPWNQLDRDSLMMTNEFCLFVFLRRALVGWLVACGGAAHGRVFLVIQ